MDGRPAERATLSGHRTAVNSITFSPDGKTLASGSDDRTVKLWDLVLGWERVTLEGHTAAVSSVVFSPDGMLLISGSSSGAIRLWRGR